MNSTVKAWAATSPSAPLSPFQFERRAVGPHDVQIELTHCGICHSDLHQVRDEWGGAVFPMVPGHEMVGRVSKVGAQVKRFQVGDLAGVGCLVDSCRTCAPCQSGLEQFCEKGPAWSYNSTEMDRTTRTYGGYSAQVVCAEAFTLKLQPGTDLAVGGAAAVRRHHHLLAAQALEGRPGEEGRRGGPGRAGPHGGEDRRRDGC